MKNTSETLYEKIIASSSLSAQELRCAYTNAFAAAEQYTYLDTAHHGAFPLVCSLEKDYRTTYEPYLCKLNPLRFYLYKKDFVPKLEDLRTILPLDGHEQLRPFSHFGWYAASAAAPFLLVGLGSDNSLAVAAFCSVALSHMAHQHYIFSRSEVFSKWKMNALFIDGVYRNLVKKQDKLTDKAFADINKLMLLMVG